MTLSPSATLFDRLLSGDVTLIKGLRVFKNTGEADHWREAILIPGSITSGDEGDGIKADWTALTASAHDASSARRWSRAHQLWMTAVLTSSTVGASSSQIAFATTQAVTAALAMSDCELADGASSAEIIEQALDGTPIARVTVARALIQMSGVSDLVALLELRANVRGTLADALGQISMVLARASRATKLKGFHQWWAYMADNYAQTWADIDQVCRLVAGGQDFGLLRQRRENLMKHLERLSYFAFGADLQAAHRMKGLLGQPFNDYSGADEERAEASYITFIDKARELHSSIDSAGGHLSRCVIEPVVLVVAAAVKQHYQATIGSALAELKMRTLKPEAARTLTGLRLELEIENLGKASAEESEVSLLPVSDGLVITPSDPYLGRVRPGQRVHVDVELRGVTSNFVDVMYELTWNDRSGLRRSSDVLTAVAQPELDWGRLGAYDSPYTERPVESLGDLKGRQSHLDVLAGGLRARKSFLVTGQKRVGKTSLVRVFLQEASRSQDVLAVHLMVGELSIAMGGADLGQVGSEIIQRIDEVARQKYGDAAPPVPSGSELSTGFNASFTRYFRSLPSATGARVVIAIDDLDELPQEFFRGLNGTAFFLALRTIITGGYVSFILVGSEILPGILRDQAMRLNLVRTLPVDYLDRTSVALMIEEPSKGWLRFTPEAVASVADWGACNPYFTSLICDQVWQSAVSTRSSWVVPRDIETAAAALLARSESTQFKHFWSDSPSVTKEERSWNEGKSAGVLLALATLQQNPFSFAPRLAVSQAVSGLSSHEAESQIVVLEDRRVVEAHPQSADLVRIRVPLFTAWVQRRGAVDLRETARDLLGAVGVNSPLTHDEVLACGGELVYQGSKIGPDVVRMWLQQFGEPADQRLMLRLLDRLGRRGLFSENRFRTSLRQLHTLVRQAAAQRSIALQTDSTDHVKNCLVTFADGGSKSGSMVARAYRSENRIPKQYCREPTELRELLEQRPFEQLVLVCVDDVIGSGKTALQGIERLKAELLDASPGWEKYLLVVYGAVVGFEDAIEHVTQRARALLKGYALPVVTAVRLTAADRAFDSESDIFETAADRLRAMQLAEDVGRDLEKLHPLGWDKAQALIVFPDTVPNNTLPIFWKEGAKYKKKVWHPLFPRT